MTGAGAWSKRNSAVLVDPRDGIGPRYDKTNLVQVLEGNPLGDWLGGLLGIYSRFTPGERSSAFPIRIRKTAANPSPMGGASDKPDESPEVLWATVNICYDSFFPHFVRSQVVEQSSNGHEPDVIINLADDMCLRFSSVFDMHLATHVFRAVENRKTYLAATNAGLSVWIDKTGRIVQQGELGVATHIVAEAHRDPTTSLYRVWGDWLPKLCAAFNLLVVLFWASGKASPWITRLRLKHSNAPMESELQQRSPTLFD